MEQDDHSQPKLAAGLLTLRSGGPPDRETSLARTVPSEYVQPLSPGWRARYSIKQIGDRLVLAGLTIEPTGEVPIQGLTPADVQKLRPGAARRDVMYRRVNSETPPERHNKRGRRPNRSFYVKIAKRLNELTRAGVTNYAAILRDEYPQYTPVGMRKTIWRLRHEMHLTDIHIGMPAFGRPAGIPATDLGLTGTTPTLLIATHKKPSRKKKATQ